MKDYKVDFKKTLEKLYKKDSHFLNVFSHGTLSVELYKPDSLDMQKPHTRDEVYIISSGKGEFLNNGKRSTFKTGDFLFVPANQEHRFENFSDDFSTWVLFYGPEGGEKV